MAAIAVALVIYFGFYVAKVFSEPYTTALAYTYTSNDSAEAVGILVRQETVLPAQTGIVDVTRSEGEKVGVGQSVAQVYRDSQAQTNQADLEALARPDPAAGVLLRRRGRGFRRQAGREHSAGRHRPPRRLRGWGL